MLLLYPLREITHEKHSQGVHTRVDNAMRGGAGSFVIARQRDRLRRDVGLVDRHVIEAQVVVDFAGFGLRLLHLRGVVEVQLAAPLPDLAVPTALAANLRKKRNKSKF